MKAYFFSVRQQYDSDHIDVLYESLGSIPKYLPLEGGTGINYLFCVSREIEQIKQICENHKYKVNGFTEVVIQDEKYNNLHKVSIYGEEEYYCLVSTQ
jgi:hypothetical protein